MNLETTVGTRRNHKKEHQQKSRAVSSDTRGTHIPPMEKAQVELISNRTEVTKTRYSDSTSKRGLNVRRKFLDYRQASRK